MWLWKIAEKMNKPEYHANPIINSENADNPQTDIHAMSDERVLEILEKVLGTDRNKKSGKIVN